MQLQFVTQLSLTAEPLQILQLTTSLFNYFNNCFTSVAEKTKSNINILLYTDYLCNTNTNMFFFNPTAKNEMTVIISSLDFHKSSGPNYIPVKILKLLKMTFLDNWEIFLICLYQLGNFPYIKTDQVLTEINHAK